MPVFAMFNIVMLAMGVVELGFLATCLVTFVAGCILGNRAIIIISLAVPAVVIGLSLFASELQEAANPFPNQMQAPTEALLPGTYVLDPISYGYLKHRHFTDLSATIVLNADKTFRVTQMPHLWVDGSDESSGYDTAAGQWTVGQNPTQNTYNVTLMADKNVIPMGAAFFTIKAPKGDRKSYALEVPIFFGDFDYIYFVRKAE